MATTKKYVSLDKLGLYDEKIKKYLSDADAEVLAQAKAHADGLADNYEAAGTVASAKAELEGKIATAQSAAEAADAKAVAAQGEVDALELVVADKADQSALNELDAYVGDIPEGYEETNIVAYINKKAEETLNSASGGSSESAASVLQALNTYKAENDPKVAANTTGVAEAKEAAAAAQSAADAVDGRVDILVGEDENKSVRTIANEELAAQLIAENAAESLDTLQEIAAWIQAHPNDASAMSKAIDDLEALVGELPEGVTATTIVGYIQEAVAAEQARAEGVEADFEDRIAALEAEVGSEEGTVAEQIAAAKQAAIDAAAADAATKDEAVLAAAQKYADNEDAKIEARVDALETASASHALASDLNALAGRVEVIEGEIDILQTEMDAVEAQAAANKAAHEANATAIAGKAAQTDLEAAVTRIAANEAAIAAFVEVSEEDINGLFPENA